MHNNARSVVICIIIIIMLLVMCATVVAKSSVDTKSKYNIVHVCDSYGDCFDYEIISYHIDSHGGAYISSKDYGEMYVPQGSYILFESDCPLCALFYHMPEKENEE